MMLPFRRNALLVCILLITLLVSCIASFANSTSSFSPVPIDQQQGDSGILYATKDGSETAQIWQMSLDGTNKIQLTNDNTAEQEWARPSPDGKSILFMKAKKGESVNFAVESNRLWVMDANGSNQREIIGLAKRDQYGWTGMAHAEWSPDSKKIVLIATLPTFTSQLFVVDENGNNAEQITWVTKIDGADASAIDPSWSTTNEIVFIRRWNCFYVCSNQDVFTLDYETREERRITNDPNWNFDPYISPDGKTFVWLSFRSSAILCPCDMIKGNVEGELNPTPIIADGGTNANGTFSSDSKSLVFLKTIGMNMVLHKISIDGSGLTLISPSPNGQTGVASYIPMSPVMNNSTSIQTSPRVSSTVALPPSTEASTTTTSVTTTTTTIPVTTRTTVIPSSPPKWLDLLWLLLWIFGAI